MKIITINLSEAKEIKKSILERTKIAIAIMNMKGGITYFNYILKNAAAFGENCVNHYKEEALKTCNELSKVCYNNQYAAYPEALTALSQCTAFYKKYSFHS